MKLTGFNGKWVPAGGGGRAAGPLGNWEVRPYQMIPEKLPDTTHNTVALFSD